MRETKSGAERGYDGPADHCSGITAAIEPEPWRDSRNRGCLIKAPSVVGNCECCCTFALARLGVDHQRRSLPYRTTSACTAACAGVARAGRVDGEQAMRRNCGVWV
jgi:hypothetical protein